MGRKVIEPEDFTYIVLTREEVDESYRYYDHFDSFVEAKKVAEEVTSPAKVVRGRRATVLRFLRRRG